MKTSSFLLISFASCTVASLALAADDLPKPQAFARYEPMMNKSPFAVATAVAPPPPPAPNFAKDLYVANLGKNGDEALVTIASNIDKNLKEYVSSREPNAHGYAIANIEMSERVGASKVTITKDGQFATLTFNQALLSQPVASAPAQPQVPSPVQVPGATPPQITIPGQVQNVPAATPFPINTTPAINTVKAAPTPMLPTPPPRVRGVIQRNPNSAGTQNPGNVPQVEPQDQ